MTFHSTNLQSKILSIKYQSELLDTDFEIRTAKIQAFKTLAVSLAGRLEPAVYLSGIDCGGGKSQLIQSFLRHWKAGGFRPDGGVLIALSRIDEVKRFADECELSKEDYAVFTSKEAVNSYGLGRERAGQARVLFTTQQMIGARMKATGSFEALEEFHFNGKPRSCRVWDESLDFASSVVIPIDTLWALPTKLRDRFPKVIQELDSFLAAMVAIGSGNEIAVPSSFEVIFDGVMAAMEHVGLIKAEQEAVRSLVALAGIKVGIEAGVNQQLALMGASQPFPADFLPITVFDASARLRHSYALQEKHRKNVVRLASSVHDYRNVTFRLAKTAMGIDRLSNPAHRAAVLSAAASVINGDGDDYLVIHHMAKAGRFDIEAELRSLVKDKSRLQFAHWGNHCASNDYRHIKKVIVLGTWRKPDWVYGAMAMASSGLGYDEATSDVRRVIRLSEQSHDLMQAVGRSNVRNVVDGVAGDVEVYAFMTPEEGLEARIGTTFPGCTVEAWQPIEKAASGQLAALISYLSSTLSMAGQKVKKMEVRAALGIKYAQGLSQLIDDDRFKQFVLGAGIVVKHTSFQRLALSQPQDLLRGSI